MRGEVGAKPSFLGRAGFASTNAVALAVQHHDVPRAEFVAVVAGLVTAGKRAEIFKVRRRTRGMELMIARCGARARPDAAPGFVVASEVFPAAVGISEVADSHDGSGNLVQQFGGGFRASKSPAVGDVTGADQNRRFRILRRRRGTM